MSNKINIIKKQMKKTPAAIAAATHITYRIHKKTFKLSLNTHMM